MKPKPSHLGLKYAEQFKDSSIVEAYPHRPPHPDEAIHGSYGELPQEPLTQNNGL
jgi:hypothetical protein